LVGFLKLADRNEDLKIKIKSNFISQFINTGIVVLILEVFYLLLFIIRLVSVSTYLILWITILKEDLWI